VPAKKAAPPKAPAKAKKRAAATPAKAKVARKAKPQAAE
jgi:hypothetical protein